jgi:LPS sulfotransferase NodH
MWFEGTKLADDGEEGRFAATALTYRDSRARQRLFGQEYDWPSTPTRMRYIVLSAPRTGSTMLCSALAASELAGCPYEYLSRVNIDLYRKLRGPTKIDAMWHDYQSRRTSPNGCFGIKMHASQFISLFGYGTAPSSEGAKFLRHFDRHILCYRRDKVDQAISRVLASEAGGEWVGGAVPDRHFQPDDVEKISNAISNLMREEEFWRHVEKRFELTVHQIAYEDLVANTEAALTEVFAFLSIPVSMGQIPSPTTVKRGNETNQRLKREYLAAVGRAA